MTKLENAVMEKEELSEDRYASLQRPQLDVLSGPQERQT